MSEITNFEVIDEEMAVLSSFLKVLFESSAYNSFITKTGKTYNIRILGNILRNTKKYCDNFSFSCLTPRKLV
jgi:hypothetical protein